MEKIKFTNSAGVSVEFGYTGAYLIKSYDGFTAADILPTYSKGYRQHGSTYLSSWLGNRVMHLEFLLAAENMAELYAMRRETEKVFNPLLGGGVLTYANDIHSKSITAAVTAAPAPVEKMGCLQVFSVELTALSPLWYDTAECAVRLQDFVGGMTFPLILPGVRFATRGDAAYIVISGDVPSPIRAEFRGNAVNPRLTLQTGEQIAVNTTIAEGEKLWISTAYGEKSVIHETAEGKTDAYHLITLDSEFFQLPVGANKVAFFANSGTPEVYLYWRNYYVGV